MKWSQVRKLTAQWQKASSRTKVISVGALVIILTISTTALINLYIHGLQTSNDETEDPYGPRASFGLILTDEEVYTNGTIRFTVYCDFNSYGGFPIPENDLFQIAKVFVCLKDDLVEFNESLGDIQNVECTTVLFGDFRLSAHEEVRLEFQSRFPLQAETQLYVGVLAFHTTVLTRWDLYTTVLVP
ncbi:MAG: hypothetical protein ACFFB5_20605 [Promethearchaeota archaeon]